MPAKSKAQYRKMQVLYRQGKITRAELGRFMSVEYKKLPARKKRRSKKKGR